MRRVLLVCGPPGAGKTTYARQTGLELYDFDDPRWQQNEGLFVRAIAQLPHQPEAQAVVIRAGATVTARLKATALIGATEVEVLATPADECIRRVLERNRPRPPMKQQIGAVRAWWRKYEADGLTPAAATAPSGVGDWSW